MVHSINIECLCVLNIFGQVAFKGMSMGKAKTIGYKEYSKSYVFCVPS